MSTQTELNITQIVEIWRQSLSSSAQESLSGYDITQLIAAVTDWHAAASGAEPSEDCP